jgi:hypothetical protein
MPPKGLPPHVSFQGVAYRVTSYDVPLRVSANRRPGRWNFADSGTTQYACLDVEAPFAEMLRHEDLRSETEAAMFRATLWQLQVNEGVVVDYGTFEKAEAAGFPPEALVDDDHELCQREAQRLDSLGAGGILSPSAALPGSTSLTLFGPRVPIAWEANVEISTAIPAQPLATGTPSEGLIERTRFFGSAHSLLSTYLAEREARRR